MIHIVNLVTYLDPKDDAFSRLVAPTSLVSLAIYPYYFPDRGQLSDGAISFNSLKYFVVAETKLQSRRVERMPV